MDGAALDALALDALGGERISWRFKGLPAAFEGRTVAELAAAKLPLSAFATPLLILDGAALDHNIEVMAGYCDAAGVDLAPHGKTTMAPQLFARQLEAGAWGVTAATITHLRVYRAFGVQRVVLGNQLLDPDALAWAAAQLDADPFFTLLSFADSVEGVALMQEALTAAGATRPLDIVLDLGLPGGRTGCRDYPTALAVARAVAGSERLRLVGVGGFEGALASDRSAAGLERVRGYLRFVRETAIGLDREGLFGDCDEIVLTAGGSAYFDDVVAILTEPWESSRRVRTLLRSGAYITHDDGHYRKLTPLGRTHSADPDPDVHSDDDAHAEHHEHDGRDGHNSHDEHSEHGENSGHDEHSEHDEHGGEAHADHEFELDVAPFHAALSILGRVVSTPEPGLALLDFGKRDAPTDLGMPEPHEVRHADGTREKLVGCEIASLADQHAFLLHGPETQLALGDIVSCGISHPCTAFDKWQLIPVVREDRVVELIRTFF